MKRVVVLGCGLVVSVITQTRLGITRFEKCPGLRLSGERSALARLEFYDGWMAWGLGRLRSQKSKKAPGLPDALFPALARCALHNYALATRDWRLVLSAGC